MKPTNMLFILSDEHNKKIAGSYGNTQIKTPHLDALAQRGTRFTSAYTNCPICVPARASLATGRQVHETRCWDNAIAYKGEQPSWGHRLMAQGHRAVSVGKLHYTQSDPQRNGFDQEILPLHIVDGLGDLLGLIRQELPVRQSSSLIGPEAGPGESDYTRYDRAVRDATVRWLKEQASQSGDKPWTLYVGFVAPHFPLIAPQEFYDLYPPESMPMPSQYAAGERPVHHPFIEKLRRSQIFDDGFTGPEMIQRALAAYYGLVSFMDDNVGQVLAALKEVGLEESTRVIYSSDHGDNLGARGLWGKSTMFEESAGIPLIVAGEGVPQGAVCDTPVSLLDIFPTILQCTGVPMNSQDADLPGHSLLDIAAGQIPERTVMSEYHAAGSATGVFMIRQGSYKYIHYVGMPAMLYDLKSDPQELKDLGADPAYASILQDCEKALRKIVDPEAVNALCLSDQAQKIASVGGVEAILKRGMFRFSPPPGAAPVMYTGKTT